MKKKKEYSALKPLMEVIRRWDADSYPTPDQIVFAAKMFAPKGKNRAVVLRAARIIARKIWKAYPKECMERVEQRGKKDTKRISGQIAKSLQVRSPFMDVFDLSR